MKQIEVQIKGISGLLMHRFSGEDRVSDGGQVVDRKDAEMVAELAAYRLPQNGKQGNLYVPAENVRRALVSAAAYEKGPGRSTLAKFAAAAIFVTPDALDLGTATYSIDSRPVVIPATKGRVLRHRPRLDHWKLTFQVEYDNSLITEKQLRAIFDHCGSKVGLLDYRPEKKGPFGRFMVTQWGT